jgi:cell division protein FtsI/penicillin-binding protein 2
VSASPLSFGVPAAADSAAGPALSPDLGGPNTPAARRVRRIAYAVFGVITVVLIGLVGRVIQLQTLTPAPLAKLIDSQHSVLPIPGCTGSLLDRQGRIICSSDVLYRLFADPAGVTDPANFAQRLSGTMGYDPVWIEQRLSVGSNPSRVLLDADVSVKRLDILHAAEPISGLALEAHARPATASPNDPAHPNDAANRNNNPANRDPAAAPMGYRLYLEPELIGDDEAFIARVGKLFQADPKLAYDPALLRAQLDHARHPHFVLLDPNLSQDRVNQVQQARIHGVGEEVRMDRAYPLGTIGGALIGFRGFDGKGAEGLEALFDPSIQARPGQISFLRDATHRALWVDRNCYQPPEDGRPVRLSIDATIQSIADTLLTQACQDFGAVSGEMVVMNPLTGEVLAMANYPPFDPNDHAARAQPQRYRNHAIADIFEPGSIFKPIVWSAATQLGYASPDENIDCTEGLWITPEGRKLHDAHGSGMQTWRGVLIKSSNIGMGKVGERMGQAPMNRAVRAFGMGCRPGSGLKGESPGMVNRLSRWTSFSITSVPMGQEIAVTPLQMTRAFCVFANGGFLLQPQMRSLEDPLCPGKPVVVNRVLTPEIALLTRNTLRCVVTDGTGKKAESSIYTVWGKTGTAQIPAPRGGGYIPGAYIGSFVGGAPLDNPRIVVGCFIHHPDPSKGHFGGIVAAPAVKQAVEQILPYLGVTPDRHPEDPRSTVATSADARE